MVIGTPTISGRPDLFKRCYGDGSGCPGFEGLWIGIKLGFEELEKAREFWLLTHTPRDTEERAFQLLGLAWADEGRADLDARAKEIEHLQQPRRRMGGTGRPRE